MHTYRKCNYKFHLLTLLLVIFWLYFHAASCFSVNVYILNLKTLAYKSSKHNCQKRFSPGKGYRFNCLFSLSIAVFFSRYLSQLELLYYCNNLATSIQTQVLLPFHLIHLRPQLLLFSVQLTFQNIFHSFIITYRVYSRR